MNLRRIKHTLLRLTAEEKVIGIGSLIILIGTFLPWYSVVMNFDKKSLTETGFSGDLGVIGFVIFLMGLISLIVLVGENLRLPLPQFGYKREQILFFFLGEAFFLTLLAMAIYTKRSLDFTEAGLRFGSYMALLGAFFGALAAFALIQKGKKKEVREFFSHEQGEEGMEEQTNEKDDDENEPTIKEIPEAMYFEEDLETLETAEEAIQESRSEEMMKDEDTKKENAEQRGYFAREAGITNKEEDDPKPGKRLTMGFYDDIN